MPRAPIHAGRSHPHQDLGVTNRGRGGVRQSEDVFGCGAVCVLDDRLHRLELSWGAVEANPQAISQMPNVSSNNPPGMAPIIPAPATPNSSSSVPPAMHA